MLEANREEEGECCSAKAKDYTGLRTAGWERVGWGGVWWLPQDASMDLQCRIEVEVLQKERIQCSSCWNTTSCM